MSTAIKLEGGGCLALMARSLREDFFFAAPLPYSLDKSFISSLFSKLIFATLIF